MAIAYLSPGVYREDEFLKPQARLPTGIAGFVGIAEARRDNDGKPLALPLSPVVLHHAEDFALYFEAGNESYLAETVRGFFLNGGSQCYVAFAETKDAQLFKAGVESLAPLHDLDLLAIPDAIRLNYDDIVDLQIWLLQHCEQQGDRFAILDIPEITPPLTHRNNLKDESASRQLSCLNGALYHPWLNIMPATGVARSMPPCGHIAGIYARRDTKSGAYRAPANEELLGVFDLTSAISHEDQKELNSSNINCIRAFPGRGIRVWGARTLSPDEQWRYINVRRLYITVRRWIDANMSWAAFEPNTPSLWIRIKRELDAYLHKLWEQGALQGDSPEQAYFVKCDSETNTTDNPDSLVSSEVGLAPIVPAEFVIIHIVHRQPATADARNN